MAHRKRPDIGPILRQIAKMVRDSKDPRATALSQLKDAEEGDPFRILIGTILSQRTRDERTAIATEQLFSRFKGPEELAGADVKEVRELIRPAGFYNMKAKSVIKVAKQLVEEFGGKVPSDMEDL
ncbi:MAG TPA: DNA lyase, partial [Nitrososphaerales archaeon]|nr:DNA lyase [Nitrososphaerales archaeon]